LLRIISAVGEGEALALSLLEILADKEADSEIFSSHVIINSSGS